MTFIAGNHMTWTSWVRCEVVTVPVHWDSILPFWGQLRCVQVQVHCTTSSLCMYYASTSLTKVDDTGKVTVKNLCLGIPPGKGFGLLGTFVLWYENEGCEFNNLHNIAGCRINGAGKTSAIMGTSDAGSRIPPTEGDARTLRGITSIMNEPEKTPYHIGYSCPRLLGAFPEWYHDWSQAFSAPLRC